MSKWINAFEILPMYAEKWMRMYKSRRKARWKRKWGRMMKRVGGN